MLGQELRKTYKRIKSGAQSPFSGAALPPVALAHIPDHALPSEKLTEVHSEQRDRRGDTALPFLHPPRCAGTTGANWCKLVRPRSPWGPAPSLRWVAPTQ